MVRIEPAGDMETVRGLWMEYWTEQNFPLEFQDFGQELETLPGVYGPPGGRLLLARCDGKAAGTIALRQLDGERAEAKPAFSDVCIVRS